MAFIQIIEFPAENTDAIKALGEEWETTTAGKGTARRAVLARDRNDASRHFNIVFFDSYEEAMKNSELPETQAMAEKMQSVASGPPTFYDLDIIEDRMM